MAKSTASTRIKPIEQYILSGLCRRVEDSLDLAADSVTVRTREEAYDVFVNKQEKKPKFPFSFLTYGDVTNSNRYRPNVTVRGVYGPHEKEAGKPFALSVIAITMGMTIEFYTDDYLRALKFISDKKFMAELSLLDFTLEYRGISFTIETQVDTTVTVPQKSRNSMDVSAFVFIVPITVNGFVTSDGGKYDTPLKKGQQLVFQARVNDEDGEILFEKTVVQT